MGKINGTGKKRRAETVSDLLKGEKTLVSRLREGNLDRRTVGNLLSRINTGVVTLVQDALDDENLAEELIQVFERAIESRTTAATPIVTTLGKTLAMRHNLEFNDHRPSKEKLKENLAGLKLILEQLDYEEKHPEPREERRKENGRSGEKQGDNQMFG